MREIKFRAWDNVNKQMYLPDTTDWDEIHLLLNGEAQSTQHSGYYQTISVFHNDAIELDLSSNVSDKNGVKIFNGDLLRIRYHLGVERQWYVDSIYQAIVTPLRGLEFSWKNLYNKEDEKSQYPLASRLNYDDNYELDHRNGNYDRIAIKDRYDNHRHETHYSNDIEVIGNIHQNPDLLQ